MASSAAALASRPCSRRSAASGGGTSATLVRRPPSSLSSDRALLRVGGAARHRHADDLLALLRRPLVADDAQLRLVAQRVAEDALHGAPCRCPRSPGPRRRSPSCRRCGRPGGCRRRPSAGCRQVQELPVGSSITRSMSAGDSPFSQDSVISRLRRRASCKRASIFSAASDFSPWARAAARSVDPVLRVLVQHGVVRRPVAGQQLARRPTPGRRCPWPPRRSPARRGTGRRRSAPTARPAGRRRGPPAGCSSRASPSPPAGSPGRRAAPGRPPRSRPARSPRPRRCSPAGSGPAPRTPTAGRRRPGGCWP